MYRQKISYYIAVLTDLKRMFSLTIKNLTRIGGKNHIQVFPISLEYNSIKAWKSSPVRDSTYVLCTYLCTYFTYVCGKMFHSVNLQT